MHIPRRYTALGQDSFAAFKFVPRTSRIVNPDGSVVFEMKDLLAPDGWSQVAVDILAQKYFRRAGVPVETERVPEAGVPEWLQRSERVRELESESARTGSSRRSESVRELESESARTGSSRSHSSTLLPSHSPTLPLPPSHSPTLPLSHTRESDARQVFHRLAGCWTYWGWKGGYFSSEADARAFFDETCYMLAAQMAAPNSPQWFNTGLHWAYGIEGPPQGHYRVDPETGEVVRSASAYEHPAPHACFIQSINDDLVNEGGIMDLWVREARIFKYGSGTGTNFSSIRGEGELLSGGGKSSGLMSFLKIGDRAAGAIKSGGTTRRAAKMVILDLDHPDIEDFINWKVTEEQKVAAIVTGSKLLNRHLNAILRACHAWPRAEEKFDRHHNQELRKAIAEAQADLIPVNYIERAL